MNKVKAGVLTLGVLLAAGWSGFAAETAERRSKSAPKALKPPQMPKGARFGALPTQILEGLAVPEPYRFQGKRTPKTRDKKGALIYAKVAPAIVLLRGPSWHGTGFLIDKAGWILTNNHMVVGAPLDPETGGTMLTAFLGKINSDGVMVPTTPGHRAIVYQVDPVKDLALLKLTPVPQGPLPALTLAKKVPAPGSDCYLIGHSGVGMLWNFRKGDISSVGEWPQGLSTNMALSLSLKGEDAKRFRQTLARTPATKIVISSCGSSGGDSGSPVVNDKGQVIAVHFAGPRNIYDKEGRLKTDRKGTSKFSYHIHLDEVRKFLGGPAKGPHKYLAGLPKQSPLSVRNPWPPGLYHKLQDMDGDGKRESLFFSLRPGAQVTGILMDLAQRNNLTERDLLKPSKLRSFKFDFAINFDPVNLRVFYATKGDANIDLILIKTTQNPNRTPDLALRKNARGVWVKDNKKYPDLLDATLFSNKVVRDRFKKIWPKARN
jgi:S1-C subfamily serine protease